MNSQHLHLMNMNLIMSPRQPGVKRDLPTPTMGTPTTSHQVKRQNSNGTAALLEPSTVLPTKKSNKPKKLTKKQQQALNNENEKLLQSANEEIAGGGGRWTKEEDLLLRKAVLSIGPKNWKRISTEFLHGTRSDVQCLHRWQKVLRPGLVKGPWTPAEDEAIVNAIRAGVTKWSEIALQIPGRIGKQCRERWFNHLDPSIKKGSWSAEEDKILIDSQEELGNRWCEIAKLLPGRSENAVKNRWNSAMRKNLMKEREEKGLKPLNTSSKPKVARPRSKTKSAFPVLPPKGDVLKSNTENSTTNTNNKTTTTKKKYAKKKKTLKVKTDDISTTGDLTSYKHFEVELARNKLFAQFPLSDFEKQQLYSAYTNLLQHPSVTPRGATLELANSLSYGQFGLALRGMSTNLASANMNANPSSKSKISATGANILTPQGNHSFNFGANLDYSLPAAVGNDWMVNPAGFDGTASVSDYAALNGGGFSPAMGYNNINASSSHLQGGLRSMTPKLGKDSTTNQPSNQLDNLFSINEDMSSSILNISLDDETFDFRNLTSPSNVHPVSGNVFSPRFAIQSPLHYQQK